MFADVVVDEQIGHHVGRGTVILGELLGIQHVQAVLEQRSYGARFLRTCFIVQFRDHVVRHFVQEGRHGKFVRIVVTVCFAETGQVVEFDDIIIGTYERE